MRQVHFLPSARPPRIRAEITKIMIIFITSTNTVSILLHTSSVTNPK
jgi:hypothetical protein